MSNRSKHFRGYSSKDAMIKSRSNPQHSAFNFRGEQREFLCPTCSALFHTDEEFKHHWKEAHSKPAPAPEKDQEAKARRQRVMNYLYGHRNPPCAQ